MDTQPVEKAPTTKRSYVCKGCGGVVSMTRRSASLAAAKEGHIPVCPGGPKLAAQ